MYFSGFSFQDTWDLQPSGGKVAEALSYFRILRFVLSHPLAEKLYPDGVKKSKKYCVGASA